MLENQSFIIIGMQRIALGRWASLHFHSAPCLLISVCFVGRELLADCCFGSLLFLLLYYIHFHLVIVKRKCHDCLLKLLCLIGRTKWIGDINVEHTYSLITFVHITGAWVDLGLCILLYVYNKMEGIHSISWNGWMSSQVVSFFLL